VSPRYLSDICLLGAYARISHSLRRSETATVQLKRAFGRLPQEGDVWARPQIHCGVFDKLEEAALYLERNPKLIKSITSFPIMPNDSDLEMV
jgi:hypothetical protein